MYRCLELFTAKDLLDLPKLSHNGTNVRLFRDKVTKEDLLFMKKDKEMKKHIQEIQDKFDQSNSSSLIILDHRKLKKFTVL